MQTSWTTAFAAKNLQQIEQIERALNESVIIAKTTVDGTIVKVNDLFCERSQYERHELIGAPFHLLNSGFHTEAYFHTLWRTIQRGDVWSGDICNRAKDGSLFWTKTTIVPILKEGTTEVDYFITIQTDISDDKQYEQMEQLAYYDELTQLPNERKFKMTIREHHRQPETERLPFSIIHCAFPDYKMTAERFGVNTIQLLMFEIASMFQSFTLKHENVTLFALHEDQFAFIVPPCSERAIRRFIQQLQRRLARPLTINGHDFQPRTLWSVAHYPQHGTSYHELIDAISIARSHAEQQTDEPIAFYNDEMAQLHTYNLLLEGSLRRAIEREELELHYQPQIQIETNEMIGVEALSRWQHATEAIPPAIFIPLAERRGFIHEIGEWSLREACRQATKWNAISERPYSMAVNISPTHFMQPNFVSQLFDILEETNMDPTQLELEITEDVVMEESQTMRATLQQLRDVGISLAIDDFGTGYSSFGLLKSFPIQSLKIDRSFVTAIDEQRESAAILQVMVELGHALQLDVVIEGVERTEELNVLRTFGPAYAQGYYYSRPLPTAELETWIHSKRSFS